MQSSEYTLLSHFKYGLLQFLAKIFGASAIALTPKLGLLDISNNYCGTGILPVPDLLSWRGLLAKIPHFRNQSETKNRFF
ncbi:MAG: hypothetical protein EAZ73_27840 [Oscillatoriales cyanobacterium]|nr:MAG: hypothetical protein EAZ73_27840 [Oscillatoriales cyanobacterium]TAF25183.1 MAG: hypothetical protein EAZ69_30190 [Oscillatoriales cyanobacterium]